VPTGRFPAGQRVRKRPEFQRIQSGGRRVITPHFALLLYARDALPDFERARLGITVSRKVGHSVIRSRAKRLVREAFRATRSMWDDDIDLVVIVRKAPLGLKLRDVVEEWNVARKQISRRAIEARKDRDRRNSSLAERG
jgi:ribonuclease P protein component